MKKLIVLMLVLGMTSYANAIILQISVDGNPDPVDSQIFLAPSETIMLDIHSPSGHTCAADDVYFALVVDPAYGSIVGGAGMLPPAPSLSMMNGQSIQTDWPGFVQLPADGPWGQVVSSPGETAAPGVYFDEFIFHCEKEGDAVVELWSSPDGAEMTLQDTLIIHQIPEPMTIALLGLGGLFLRRRK